MPKFALHGVEVFYRDEGAGVPIILGHSSTGSSGQWRDLIARLSGYFRLFAPDHLGYGRTGAHPGTPPLFEFETSIIEALIALAGTKVHLVGHSYGGAIMARVAVQNLDRLRSLCLIEPTLFHLLHPAGRNDEHAEIKAVADRVVQCFDAGDPEEASRGFIDYWVTEGAYDAMDERVRNAVIASMPKLRVEWPEAFQPWGATTAALRNVRVPVQLIRATRTTRAASAVIDLLQEIWPGSDLQEVEEAGHMSPMTHPNRVNSILEEFLKRVCATP